jgi:CcmD family protein
MSYLFFGYAVFWSLLFVYLLFLHRHQRRLNEELQALSEELGTRGLIDKH